MPFPAKFSGRCGNGDRIEPGDQVEYVDDILVHTECTDQSPEEKTTQFQGTSLEEMGY